MKKKILFITATRADFGKLKSIISTTKKSKKFKVHIVVTGMHVLKEFGNTYTEITKSFGKNIIKFSNQKIGDNINTILSNTINKFLNIFLKVKPDLIVYHGDRIETLAAAIVGSLNHLLTAHIEGGELSGTIDDTIRHSVTKLSHIHLVGNTKAFNRVVKMGEKKENVFIIGSPDMDILFKKQPKINAVKKRYGINFKNYSILIWHPVTSEIKSLKESTIKLVSNLDKLDQNFVVINPNNDPGYKIILNIYKNYFKNNKFKFLKSMRFENFISLLKNSEYIIGNSSSAIYEAPPLKIPSINIGTRQNKRIKSGSILNLNIKDLNKKIIDKYLNNYNPSKKKFFGEGDSGKKFLNLVETKKFWDISTQKYFQDN